SLRGDGRRPPAPLEHLAQAQRDPPYPPSSDLSGTHSWLVDVGGGVAREHVASGGRVPVERPTDEELRDALGADRIERTGMGETTERVVYQTGAGHGVCVLKVSGFWRTSVEHILYTHVLHPQLEGSPALVGHGDNWLLLEYLEGNAVAV